MEQGGTMHLGNRPPDAAWPLLLLLFLLVRADILPKRIDPLPQSREVFTCLLRPPRSRRGLGLSGPPPCPTSEAGACLGRDASSSSNPPSPGAGRPAATHSERAEAEQHVHRLDDLRQGIRPAGDRDLVPLRLRLPASSHAFSSSSRSLSLRWTIFLSASCPIISTQ